MHSVTEKLKLSQNIFLTGGAGVGKTTATRTIIREYEEEGKKVAKLASTGMAATLIGGQTLHSFFDLGIADSLADLKMRGKLNTKKKIKKLIASMDLIVIDEISMVSAALLDMIEHRIVESGFTGSILVVGDFLQLPPVVRGCGGISFAFESESWQRFGFETITLTFNYRTEDAEFVEILNAVRFAQVGEREHLYLHNLIKPLAEDLSQYTFLYGKNASASRHNRQQLAFIDSDELSFESQVIRHDDSVQDDEIDRFYNDARIERVLCAKIGAPVLFTRNSWNYFNGERGRIVKVDNEKIYIEKSNGIVVKLERTGISKHKWREVTIDGKKETVEVALFTVYQYPIALAFAITIHKSQGMSIDDLIIESNEIFAPSQFYVALSRAISPHRLILIQPSKDWRHLAFVHKKALEFVRKNMIQM
ncbi:MAG: ATPase [Helicobacteraceae bacterium 4484_230]|nr:MAG: ATPase [Helicobacteraceae bacterium 4484_230]